MTITEGIIACIPIAVLIIGALITKRMTEMIIISSIIGTLLIYKTHFLGNYIGIMYEALSNSSFQFLILILFGFGGIIKLLEKSGALLGFANILGKFANTRKKAMICTWIMGIIIFVDDYLNILSVSFSMKNITDKNRIPREHLAYGVGSMGAAICVLIPFTSWAAFAIGCIDEYSLGFMDYVKSLPLMFFPIIAIVVSLLVAIGVIPKVGFLKKAYERVDAGGEVWVEEKQSGAALVNLDDNNASDIKASSPLNFFIPLIALIVGMLIFNQDVISGIAIALVVQLIMYLPQKIMKLDDFIGNFFDGVSGMAPLAVVMCFTYMLNICNTQLGFAEFIANGMKNVIPQNMYAFIPALVFVLVAFLAFAVASFWPLIIITAPIFIPLAIETGVNPVLVIAAIMSGVAFGSKFCFSSDAVFMTSAGAGISNMTYIKTAAPYVLGSAAIATIGFIIAGIVMI